MLCEKESFCSGFMLICFFSAQTSDTTDFLYRKSFFTAKTFLLYKEREFIFLPVHVSQKKKITHTVVIALLHTIQRFVHNGRKHRKTVRLSRQDVP